MLADRGEGKGMNETMMQNRMESAAGEPILEVIGLGKYFRT